MLSFKDYSFVPCNFTGQCYLEYSKAICLFENGRFHNEIGPAVVYDDGGEEWYYEGQLHRLDGQADPADSEGKGFYIYGSPYRETKYWNHPFVIKYRLKLIEQTEG